MVVNGLILLLVLYVGTMARKTMLQRQYQETLLIVPSKEKEPPPPPKVKLPPIELPKISEMKFDAPKIAMPKPEPEVKPLQMEAKLTAPVIKAAKQQVILAPQPKSALAGAAMPAQDKNVKASTKPVHFGDTFGVTPNPNARGRATVAAIGNPYGGMKGPAVAPHGVVGSTGFGNGTRVGSSAGVVGRVASAGVPRATNTAAVNHGRVAAAGIPTGPTASAQASSSFHERPPTSLEVLSKPSVQYTSEARQLKVQGDVVLRVTFTASGQVVVKGIVHGLGHGLDEEARRVAQQIRFRPATRNGQSVDTTTNITITFQLA
jgi:TonB family protein